MVDPPSRAALWAWLNPAGAAARAQGELAAALTGRLGRHVTQQRVSRLLHPRPGRRADGEPDPGLAQAIEAVTGVPWRGWYSEERVRQIEAQAAALLATRAPS
jgi:hypothetical protein